MNQNLKMSQVGEDFDGLPSCFMKAPFTYSRFSLRFTTIHPDFSWSEKSGWTGMNRGEKWKYSMSLPFQYECLRY